MVKENVPICPEQVTSAKEKSGKLLMVMTFYGL